MTKKIVIKIIIVFYVAVAAFTTFSMLKYNNKNFAELNNKVFINLKHNISNYKKGSILIVENKEYLLGDNTFYCQLKKGKCNVKYGKIDEIINDDYFINNEVIPEKLLIGTDKKVISIPFFGYLMQVLESRWGYLLLIVVPILFGFIYEIYVVTNEIKNKKESLEDNNAKQN